jgi:hypothetical protein
MQRTFWQRIVGRLSKWKNRTAALIGNLSGTELPTLPGDATPRVKICSRLLVMSFQFFF